jgi:hypothetical protein
MIGLDNSKDLHKRDISVVPAQSCWPVLVKAVPRAQPQLRENVADGIEASTIAYRREEAEHVIANVDLESGKDRQWISPDPLRYRFVLLDEMSQKALTAYSMGAKVMICDTDDVQAYLMAAHQIPTSLFLEVGFRSERGKAQRVVLTPVPCVLRGLDLEVALEPSHALVSVHHSTRWKDINLASPAPP